jgi:hypothetical protein
VLVPPKHEKPMKLYIAAAENSIGSSLVQDNEEGQEHAIFYFSGVLKNIECRYFPKLGWC